MDQNRPPKINYASDILVNFETNFGQFNNYVTLKTEIFAPHPPVCVTQHFEHFEYVIVDIQPIISDCVFPLEKNFDEREL